MGDLYQDGHVFDNFCVELNNKLMNSELLFFVIIQNMKNVLVCDGLYLNCIGLWPILSLSINI